MPVGVLDVEEYQDHGVSMKPGDRLYFYSDPDARRIEIFDQATGERLLTDDEAREAAEGQAEAAERKTKEEKDARQAAEAKVQEKDAALKAAEEEVARLRALLRGRS